MELHQLRYFVTVVREGTFTKAAERLYITQPSLSEQVRKLEQELGSPLFERLGRTLALTNAGEAFLPHAERVLVEVEQARLRVQEVRGLRRGRITIGALPSAAGRLLPRYLAEFQHRFPGIEVALQEEDVSVSIEDLVHQGQLDMAIVRLPRRRLDLAARPLHREPMVLLTSPEHRLSCRSSVALAEVADEPFVVMKRGNGLRQLLEGVCGRAGFEPRVAVETGQLCSMVGLVLGGVGITVLPQMAAGSEGCQIPISDPFAHRELGVVWRQGHSLGPAASAFLGMLKQLDAASVTH